MKVFVIFRNMNDYLKFIFENYERADVLVDKELKSRILNGIKNLQTSIKLNKKFEIPLKSIWFPFYLDYSNINADECNYFIFFEGSKVAYQKKYLEFLKHRYLKSKFIFRFVNPVNETNEWALDFIKLNYDMIISMNQNDCEKNDWIYVSNTYNIENSFSNNKVDIDVFFVGSNKGRLKVLIKIYQFLTALGLRCLFFIADVRKEERVLGFSGVKYIKKMTYKETLTYISRSKCLLEIIQKGQTGSTLRPFEALVYRKKLLTNDKNILKQNYYDGDNMLYFEKISDINPDFINQEFISKKTILEKISHDVLFNEIITYFN